MITHTKHSAVARPVNRESDLLTVREVAKQLRVDDTTVRRWVRQGTLDAVILPQSGAHSLYRIRRDTLNRLLNGGRIDE